MASRTLLRVHKEIQDVNDDFHSLRTVLKETENKSKWKFIMFPNDGALSHLPLIGELIIPEYYPTNPPVLHLFTRTLRGNVDVYRSYIRDDTRSTMCFDILRSKSSGGTWDPEYTISCLFASLMQALVTPMVPQDYGGEKAEFVNMATLAEIKKNVETTYRAHKEHIPSLPTIPTIPAVAIPAKALTFTRLGQQEPLRSLDFIKENMYISQAIYLQDFERPQFWSQKPTSRRCVLGDSFKQAWGRSGRQEERHDPATKWSHWHRREEAGRPTAQMVLPRETLE